MGSSTLVREWLRGVSTTLVDISPQFSRYTEVELIRYANYGQMAIAKYLPQAGSGQDAIKLKPGTKQDLTKVLAADIKPGDGSTAADTYGIALLDVPRNMGSDGLTPGRVIRVVDRYTLDMNAPDWHSSTGAAVREYLHDPAMPCVFYVYPGVPVGGLWVDVAWMKEPRRIPAGGEPGGYAYAWDGTSTVTLGIDDQFAPELHDYVCALALMKGSKNTQNLPKAGVHANAFINSINVLAQRLNGVNPNLRELPFAADIPQAAG